MARQLWLLRHAEAEPHGARADAERRLTQRGEHQARAAGQALVRLGARFDAVLVSPKVRARDTAALASAAWSDEERDRAQLHPPLAAGFDARQALDALADVGTDGWLMVVGHEPDLSRIVADLTGACIDLKKGGLAVVRLGDAAGELVLLLRPRELALIADLAAVDI
jgi:phosphohistidine phosphatase